MSDTQKARWKEIKDAFVRQGRSGKKGDDPVARVTGALSGVDEQLQRIREAISHATIAANSKDESASLAPILEKLTSALRPMGKAPKVDLRIDDGSAAAAVAVVNVVREQTAVFEKVVQSLAELVKRNIEQAPDTQRMPPPQLAPGQPKTNPGFPAASQVSRAPQPPPPQPHQPTMLDARMEELLSAVRRLEQRLSTLATSLPRFDVSLDSSSPSTFYRSLDGDDVVRFGGIFVATYAKLPPLGAILQLGLDFPGGARADCQAQVSWIQEHLGDDTPAGFGAKLVNPSGDLCAMIAQFTRFRDPLVRD